MILIKKHKLPNLISVGSNFGGIVRSVHTKLSGNQRILIIIMDKY